MSEFCSKCGAKLKDGDKFCAKCGSETSSVISATTKSQTKTLEHYMTSKSNQRSGFIGKKRKQEKTTTVPVDKSTKAGDSDRVVINVGKMTENENGELRAIRGSKLPIKVCKAFDAKQVLASAVQKHSNHDQYFQQNVEYVLLYPDKKIVDKVPGTEDEFTVVSYKRELTKPYSKVDLFLCKTTEYTAHLSGPTEDLHTFLDHQKLPTVKGSMLVNSSDDDSVITVLQTSAFDDVQPESATAVNAKRPKLSQRDVDPVNAMMRCPICNLKFPYYEIEEHADCCATSQATPYLCIPDGSDFQSDQPEFEHDALDGQPEANIFHSIENKSEIKHEVTRVIKLGASIDSTEHVRISVRRGFAFRDFHSFFSKHWNKQKHSHPYMFTFVGEAGIDTGGVSREFYSEALKEIKSQFFTGNDDQGYEPCCGLVSIADGTIHSIGHLFAATLCNNGPNPGFLAPWVYNYFTGGVQAVLQSLPELAPELPESSLYNTIYKELSAAESDCEVSNIFKSDEALSMLEAVGYRGDPTKAKIENKNSVLQSLFIKARIEPLLTALNEIMSGLTCYNMLHVIQENVKLCHGVFCQSDIFSWDHKTFLDILMPQFSDEGSTKKSLEVTTYKSFLDFTEACCYDEASAISLKELMQFITGTATLPCLGLPDDLTVEFIHGCNIKCKCLPTVSTCAICLRLPIHINTEEEMREVFNTAIKGGIGFGLC